MSRAAPTAQRNELRIIGGRWRGRRLRFPAAQGLRPTGDRIRETAFNWLQTQIPAAHCLDLFAGSGAMGFEALSRGAERVVMVERSAPVAQALRDNARLLEAGKAEIIAGDALAFLNGPAHAFDVVFLDPPFDSDIIGDCCARLEQGGWLAPGARIYLEQPTQRPLPSLPDHWELLRSKRAGQVAYYLAGRDRSEQEAL